MQDLKIVYCIHLRELYLSRKVKFTQVDLASRKPKGVSKNFKNFRDAGQCPIPGPFLSGPFGILLGIGFGTVGAGTLFANWVLSFSRSLIKNLKKTLRQTQARRES